MADLEACYFCGSVPDGSLREYAVVPPDLDPDGDKQRSVVLCPTCREKLTKVLEPVVDAAGSHAGGTAAEQTTLPTGDDEEGEESPASPTDEAATGSPAEDAAPADDGEPANDDASGDSDHVEVPRAETAADDAGDEVTVDPGGEPGEEASAGSGAADGSADDPTDERPAPDSNAPRDQPHADDEMVGRNNEAYNKTLRLLQNREFPVERHEIEQVAANAYQLDPQEVSDAIDSLIRKGLLVQEGAHLSRP